MTGAVVQFGLPPDATAPALTSVLFSCTFNAVRSPMAECLLKHFMGHKLYIDSAGVRPGEINPFAVEAMREVGLDLSRHGAKQFADLPDDSFDLVISLSPEAHHRAMELTRTTACEVEYWPTADPTLATGNREARIAAFREVRDALTARIRKRFGLEDVPPPGEGQPA